MPRKKWTAASDMPDQAGHVAIVTGSNTGIGLETAAALARHGACVVVACRDEAKGRAAAARIAAGGVSGTLDVMVLDLADLASVRSFSAAFHDGFDRLDLLINNAGVMSSGRCPRTSSVGSSPCRPTDACRSRDVAANAGSSGRASPTPAPVLAATGRWANGAPSLPASRLA